MQLPTPQLSDALIICPELKQPLKEHLMNFTEGQRAHIPAAIQDIVLGTSLQHPAPTPVLPPVIQAPIETSSEETVSTFICALEQKSNFCFCRCSKLEARHWQSLYLLEWIKLYIFYIYIIKNQDI